MYDALNFPINHLNYHDALTRGEHVAVDVCMKECCSLHLIAKMGFVPSADRYEQNRLFVFLFPSTSFCSRKYLEIGRIADALRLGDDVNTANVYNVYYA